MVRRRSKKTDQAVGCLIFLVIAAAAVSSAFDAIAPLLPSPETIGALAMIGVIAVMLVLVGRRFAERARQKREAHEFAAWQDAERRRLAAQEVAERQRLERALEQRRLYLTEKYEDPIIVQAILAAHIWHDMTKDQLVEAWGRPAEITRKVLKTKVKETYKYDRTGANRFARRAYLENDRVTGWED